MKKGDYMRKIINDKEIVMGVCYYPEHWDKKLWEEDLRRMSEAGLKTVRIGEFAWNVVEPEEGVYDYSLFDEFLDMAQKNGIGVIFCTPSATPPAWLTNKYPEVLNASKDGLLYKHGARRHYNYNSIVYRKYVSDIVEKYAEHYGRHEAVIGWQIDNEINCEAGEFYSESDDKAFNIFLREKYKCIEELNKAWGTVFWNQIYTEWSEVHIPRKTVNNTVNPHQALDYFRFISESARSFTKMQSDIIKKYIKEDDFITTNGLFGNLDNHKLTEESLDFMCYDSYPNFAYLVDSYNPANKYKDRHWSMNLTETRSISDNFGIMEQQTGANGWTMWMGAPTPRPGQINLWTMQSIAHGADFVSYFRWRTCTVGTEIYWHGILDYSGRDNRRLMEIKDICNKIHMMNDIAGSRYEAKVAVIRDYDNIWDGQGDVWHGRMTWHSEEGLFDGLQSSHTPFDYIYLHDDTDKELLCRYKVIFYPHGALLNDKRMEILKEYVNNGGILIFGARTGFKDMMGRCVMDKLPGKAAELSGTDVYEYTICAPDEEVMKVRWNEDVFDAPVFNDFLKATGKNAKEVGFYDNSYYKGVAAVVENQYGKGKVYYFGGCFNKDTAEAFLKNTGVISPYSGIIDLEENCEIAVRSSGNGKKYMFVLNYSKEEAYINLKKTVKDIFTKEELSGKIAIAPYGTVIYEI